MLVQYSHAPISIGLSLISLQSQLHVPVPLSSVVVEAKVVDFTAKVDVVQQYVNKERQPIEVVYYFPVEEEAAVVGFEADVDGRTITGKVQEKVAAAREYQEAVDNRQTAILLEETSPDIFQIKLGHLPPGAGAKVTKRSPTFHLSTQLRLTYLCELPVEEGKIRLTIPTTVAPRCHFIPPLQP